MCLLSHCFGYAEPLGQYEFVGHSTSLYLESALQYDPPEQVIIVALIYGQEFPSSHSVGYEDPSLQYDPVGQPKQEESSIAPISDEYVPAGHG